MRITVATLSLGVSLLSVGSALAQPPLQTQAPGSATTATAGATPVPAAATPDQTTAKTDPSADIVVTAQRRSENIQRVPLAMTGLGEAELAHLAVSNATDIATRVPSLRFVNLGGSVVNYNIRGISQNDFTDHLEPPIALYQDDTYLSTATQASLPVFDTQRVEVLRGPQGTLFGRNATGGLIQFISNQPTKQFEGYGDITLADDFWGRFEGAVSGPLSDKVQARLAVVTSTRQGYVENSGPGGGRLGNENYAAVRGILAIQPTDTVRLNINVRYYNNFDQHGAANSFAPTIATANGLGRFVGPNENPYGTGNGQGAPFYAGYLQPDPYKGSYSTPGSFHREAAGGTFKIEKDIGDITVMSISDYQHLTKRYFEDVDATPSPVATDRHDQKLDQVTQELRAVEGTGAFRWSTGFYFYYQHSRTLNQYDIFAGVLNPLGTVNLKTHSYAVYGQADYDVASTVTVTLGGRYTLDKKSIDFRLADPAVPLPAFVFNQSTYPDLAHQSNNLYSARASVQWKPDPRTLVYASFNRGVKGGSYSFPYFLPVSPTTLGFRPETLYSYEVGEKWTSPGGGLRINTSAFYYDYHNYQAFIFAAVPGGQPVGTIRNLDATAKGIEAELVLRPSRRLTAGVNVAVLGTNVKGVVLPDGEIVERNLPQAPGFSGNASLRYELPVLGDKVLALQGNVNWNGSQSLTVLSAPDEREPGYALGDLRLSLARDDNRWEVALFVKNVWNERYRIFAYDLSAFGTIAQAYNRPRTVGGTLRRRF